MQKNLVNFRLGIVNNPLLQLSVFVCLMLVTAWFGGAGHIVQHLLSPLFNMATDYADYAAHETAKTLQVVTALNGVVELIQSGEIGVSFIVDMQVTVGELLVALNATLTKAYEALMLDLSIWKGITLLLSLIHFLSPALVLMICIAILFIVLCRVIKWDNSQFYRALQRSIHYLWGVFFATMVLAPTAIILSGSLTTELSQTMLNDIHLHYQRMHEEIKPEQQSDYKETAKSVIAQAETLASNLADKVSATINKVSLHTALLLFNTIALPVLLWFFMTCFSYLFFKPKSVNEKLLDYLIKERSKVLGN